MGDEVPDVLAIYHLKFGGGAADSASIGSDIVGRHDNTLPRRHGDAARAPADGVRRHPARRDARGAARKQAERRSQTEKIQTKEKLGASEWARERQ